MVLVIEIIMKIEMKIMDNEQEDLIAIVVVVSFGIVLFMFDRYFSIARNGDFQDRNNRFRNNQEEDNNENNGTQRFPST